MQHARVHPRPAPHDGIPRRTARRLGWAGLLAAVVGPAVLWRNAIGAVATDFSFNPAYLLTGWLGYALIVAGVLFMLPVVISIGRHPEDRFYPRSRNAYAGWGVCLYLLGCAIAVQIAQIAAGPGDP